MRFYNKSVNNKGETARGKYALTTRCDNVRAFTTPAFFPLFQCYNVNAKAIR